MAPRHRRGRSDHPHRRGGASAVAFAPDGQLVAAPGRVYGTEQGKRRQLQFPPAPLFCGSTPPLQGEKWVTFSREHSRLWIMLDERLPGATPVVWDLATAHVRMLKGDAADSGISFLPGTRGEMASIRIGGKKTEGWFLRPATERSGTTPCS